MSTLKERLTDILISSKMITQEQLNQAIEVQKGKGGRLSDIIVELKFIKENELTLTLSKGLGFPLIDLKRCKIDPEVVKIIPVNIARQYQILPISKLGDTVTLAMADPLNIFAIDHVSSLTGYKINPIISSSQDIMQAIETTCPDTASGMVDDLVKEISTTSSIELIKEEKEFQPNDQELNKISRQTPVIKITNMILEEAIKKRTSDIMIEPLEKRLRIRYRIDGILQEQQAPPKNMHASIVSRIKVMSELDIAEHRLPQDSRFKLKIIGKEVDFRVSVLPTATGEKVVLRVLDKSSASLELDRLGLAENTVTKIKKIAKLPHGMILVCGPTGSGKTTTLYSVLKYIDSPQKNIVTVEDPVEYQMDGINQVPVRSEVGLTFAAALRSILRQDPNVIMIGEIRDFETIDIAIKSALTGHLVLSTIHTNTACGTIMRIVNMGVEPFLINSSLVCAVAQRLVRKICPECKEEYKAPPELLASLKLNPDLAKTAVFYKGKGCDKCFKLGYSGRIAVTEILLLSSEIREMIITRAQEHIIKAQARKEGMITLREDGMRLALAGVTTLDEVLRVTAPDEIDTQE